GESRQSLVSPEATSTVAEEHTASSIEGTRPETEEVSKAAAADVAEDNHEPKEQQASSHSPTETRYHRQFERSFRFAQPVNPEGITAKLENGLLSIAVPKAVKFHRSIPISA
ncbi:hypothetical protein IWQ61_010388, partial [Dispira simplex]